MQNEHQRHLNSWPGWTTDLFYYQLCEAFGWAEDKVKYSFENLNELYVKKRELVTKVDPTWRKNAAVYETAELASWWYDPSTHKIDREGQLPGSSIQLGRKCPHLSVFGNRKTHSVAS